MQKHKTVRGIIFDMDNTLLKSRIDFKAMKLDIFQYLVNRNAVPRDLPIEQHTTATFIEHAKGLQFTAEMECEVWAIASRLKPSPSGFLYVLKQFADVPAGQWISVGDSWIDGKASNQTGVPFVCYQTDEAVMSGRDVQTVGRIDEMQELSKYLDFS